MIDEKGRTSTLKSLNLKKDKKLRPNHDFFRVHYALIDFRQVNIYNIGTLLARGSQDAPPTSEQQRKQMRRSDLVNEEMHWKRTT